MVFLIAASALFAAGSSGGTGGGSAGGGGAGGRAPDGAKTALDWYNAGYTASEAKSYAEAISDFTSALELNSNYAEAYNMLGFCTRKMGNVAKAFTYYETALRLKPNFPEAREYYGEAYLQSGNLAKAVQQYIILAKAHNKNADELLDQIDLYVNQKG
jgi:tetratricopeptide (TPR) repeat protein